MNTIDNKIEGVKAILTKMVNGEVIAKHSLTGIEFSVVVDSKRYAPRILSATISINLIDSPFIEDKTIALAVYNKYIEILKKEKGVE